MSEHEAVWKKEDLDFVEKIDRDLSLLKERGIFDNKEIALIGSWINQEKIQTVLKKLGLKLSHIADNNPNKQGIMRLGIKTQSVESLGHDNPPVILVSGYYSHEISEQLIRLGYEKNKDFYTVATGSDEDKIAGHVITEKLWEEYKECAIRGFKSYCTLKEKYGDMPMWLMHQPSLGDLYILSLFLPYVYGKKSIAECDCVLIVVRRSTQKLAEILGYRYIELVSLEEASMDWLFMIRLMGNKVNVKNAVCHGFGRTNVFLSLAQYGGFTFRDGFVKYVLGLDGNPSPIYPKFPSRTEYVREQFSELGLIEGKTVVLSPYAGHFTPSISEEHWDMLINGLKKKGYTLCTNCASPDEKPLKGTAAAYIDLKDCVEFVERAGAFVGVRSGLCDLICMAGANKTIIYEKGATNNSIDFFGFIKMGIGRNITEFDNDCINTDKMMKEILALY